MSDAVLYGSDMSTCPRRYESNGKEGLDYWSTRSGEKVCSYCGSLYPETMLKWIAEGLASLGPTDKDYKVYVKKGPVTWKHYFVHLSIPEKDEFITLYNTKPRPFNIEFPGHFYVIPYFATRVVNAHAVHGNGQNEQEEVNDGG